MWWRGAVVRTSGVSTKLFYVERDNTATGDRNLLTVPENWEIWNRFFSL